MAANHSTLSLQLAAMLRVCMICNDFFFFLEDASTVSQRTPSRSSLFYTTLCGEGKDRLAWPDNSCIALGSKWAAVSLSHNTGPVTTEKWFPRKTPEEVKSSISWTLAALLMFVSDSLYLEAILSVSYNHFELRKYICDLLPFCL